MWILGLSLLAGCVKYDTMTTLLFYFSCSITFIAVKSIINSL